jgi:hypothetical protein
MIFMIQQIDGYFSKEFLDDHSGRIRFNLQDAEFYFTRDYKEIKLTCT